jgi:ribosome-binding factor A
MPRKTTHARQDRGPTQRQLRVGELIRHALAGMLERGEARDPELAGRVVTVTEVRPSPDLKTATAFVMPLGGEDEPAAVAALARAAPYLRRRIAEEVNLRFAPELRFALDTSFDTADRIERLLRSPEVARDLGEEGDAAGDAQGDTRRDDDPGTRGMRAATTGGAEDDATLRGGDDEA